MKCLKYLMLQILSDQEPELLLRNVNTGKASIKRLLHINILLAGDNNNPDKASSPVIAERFQVYGQTVQTVRITYASQGLEAALAQRNRPKPPFTPRLTREVEGRIIAICSRNPTPGVERWTLPLVAEEALWLEILPSISHPSVGRILIKASGSLL